MADLERVYTVPLGKVYNYPRTRRAIKAAKMVRSFIARHFKTDVENVRLSNMVNAYIWKRGIQKPPRRIKVKAKKFNEKVFVFVMDEKDDLSVFGVKEKTEKPKPEGKKSETKKESEKGDTEKSKSGKKSSKGKKSDTEPGNEKKEKTKEKSEEQNTEKTKKKTKGEKLLETQRES